VTEPAKNPYAAPRAAEPPPHLAGSARAPTFAKLAVLASVYFAQGLPFGYFTQVMPNLLRDRGASLIVVGLSSAVAAPWALKFLWAPLVDKYGSARFGRRKSWILPLQAAMTGLLVGLAFSSDASMAWFAAAVFVANLLAATQDIATDGLAVDILEPHERGIANGIQVGGYRFGMILGGSALVLVLVRFGAQAAFLAMALLLATASIPALFAREAPRPRPAAPHVENKRPPGHFLRRKDAPRILALIATYKLGDAFATGMLRPFLKERGFSLEDQAVLLGTYGSVAGMVGALVGGALLLPLGRKRALLIFGALQLVTMAAYAAAAAGIGGRPWIYGACTVEHFISGMATASLFAVMMDFCRREHAATDYTVQASAVVIATGAAQLLSGVFAQTFGYFAHFVASAGLASAAIPAVVWLYRKDEPAPPSAAVSTP
jgi:PAT family beta-lactamase induction signal transducer AmpG